MSAVTRRHLLSGAIGLGVSGAGTGAYALAVEPRLRLETTSYTLAPRQWAGGPKLTIAVLADIHGREPNMGAHRIEQVIETTAGLNADLILLLGLAYAWRKGVLTWR